ncbi:putative transporter svop-1 [Hyposmocoma kahamanoa]|uniref:putative transporter svop-1 n=1 Tax=Hyposmocoma kahamanoa TaxID=1477025 RepID=UPI000E6D7F30|nr:putative transporter svop-1 [Hyposmocoma kahamanoa]
MSSDNNNMDLGKVSFESAINEAGFGLYSYLLTSLTGLCIISYACVVYGGTFIVPASACELGTTTSQQGILVAGPVLGTIIGAAFWGYLADKRGRKSMLLVSLAGGLVMILLASISVNWIMLMVLQFIASLFASGQYSLPMAILSESVPMAKRNFVVLLVTSIFLLAQGLMALVAIPIIPLPFSYHVPGLGIQWNSWRTLMVVFTSPSIICFIWLLFMQESPKFVFSKGNEEGALNILRFIHKMNNRKGQEELPVKGLLQLTSDAPEQKGAMKELFKAPLLKYFIIMTTLSMFLQVGSFVVWLPTIANQFVEILRTGEGYESNLCAIIIMGEQAPPNEDVAPCSLNMISLLIVFGVGSLHSIVNIIISLFVDRAGRRNMAMGVAAFTGLCGIITNLIPNAIGSAAVFVMFTTGLLLVGLYTAMSIALFPTHLRALAISLTMTGGRMMVFVVIQILNLLLNSNCELGFYLFATLVASSAIVAAFLPDDRKLITATTVARKSDTLTEEMETENEKYTAL